MSTNSPQQLETTRDTLSIYFQDVTNNISSEGKAICFTESTKKNSNVDDTGKSATPENWW